MPQQAVNSLSKIQDLEAQLTDLTHQLIVEFKKLEIEELRKQAQLRGVLNVELMNRDELVVAIFERRGEREKVLSRFLGQIKE